MSDSQTIHVRHLGGIDAAYKMPSYNPTKPTIVLVAPWTTSLDIFSTQFDDKELTDSANLLAIDLLGQGYTRTKSDTWTYWDSARMNFQVLDALGIGRVFVLGTAQGGWVAVRMVLLEPDRILGIIPLSTSMDSESADSRSRNCWDGPAILTPIIESLTASEPTPEFVIEPEFCSMIFDSGVGDLFSNSESKLCRDQFGKVYSGDEGRRRLRMACIAARDRESLHDRLAEVKCPVLWMHGSEDPTFPQEQAEYEINMFTGSRDASLIVVKEGWHFLHRSHPRDVNMSVICFSKAHSNSDR